MQAVVKANNESKWLYSSIFKEIKKDLLIYSLFNLLISYP